MALLRQCTRLTRRLPNSARTQVTRNLFVSSSTILCSDKTKNDKDVKSLLNEIYDDFEKIENIQRPPEPDTTEASEASVKGGEVQSESSDKNDSTQRNDLENLLSQLYKEEEESSGAAGSSLGGYTTYKDADARVIYDVDEERILLKEAYESGRTLELEKDKRRQQTSRYQDLEKKRGVSGVFDLEEILTVLKGERLKDIAVIKVPAARAYSDYVVIGTGSNARHLYVTSQVIKKLFKMKYDPLRDKVPIIEGGGRGGDPGWIAIDMGNIVLHLFRQSERREYDLESLWTVGSKYDEKSIAQESSMDQLMASHLAEFEPLEEDAPVLFPQPRPPTKYHPVYE